MVAISAIIGKPDAGKEDEARECFKLFDKRDRNFIVAADLK